MKRQEPNLHNNHGLRLRALNKHLSGSDAALLSAIAEYLGRHVMSEATEIYEVSRQNADGAWSVIDDLFIRAFMDGDETYEPNETFSFRNNHRKYHFFGEKPPHEAPEPPEARVLITVGYHDHSGVSLFVGSGSGWDSGTAGWLFVNDDNYAALRAHHQELPDAEFDALVKTMLEDAVAYENAALNGTFYYARPFSLNPAMGDAIANASDHAPFLTLAEALDDVCREMTSPWVSENVSPLDDAIRARQHWNTERRKLRELCGESLYSELDASFRWGIPDRVCHALTERLSPKAGT